MQADVDSRIQHKRHEGLRKAFHNYQLYLFILPVVVYFLVIHYMPMYGVQIAFKDFVAARGFWGSPWVGVKHFRRFFDSFEFTRILTNTLRLSVFQLLAGFPIPIIVALLLNQFDLKRYKKFIQTVIYAPHFISTVVLVGMLFTFLAPRTGWVNHLIEFFGGERTMFMGESTWFRPLYVMSEVWQRTGWGTIVYLAALSAISPTLHESAIVDGANKIQRILHIDIPGILQTATILLILNIGRIMSIGFEKAFLMQTALNLQASEIISTYVYKIGLLNGQFSFSSAVGLFNSVINFLLLITVNHVAKKAGDVALW